MALVDGVPATAANFNAAFVSTGGNNTYSGTNTYDKETIMKEIASPSTPPAGYVALYAKTDSELYFKNDAGTETKVSNLGNLAYTTKSTTYVALTTDDVILCSASGGSWTLTLPTAVGITGKTYVIGRTDQTLANAVTIDADGTETINGAANTKLATQGERVKLISDGANWQIIERYIPSSWTSFTPTGTWIANTTYTGYWRRVGDSIEISYSVVVSGAPTSANLYVNLPTGLTMNETKFVTTDKPFGIIVVSNEGVLSYAGTAQHGGTNTTIYCSVNNTASTYGSTVSVTQAVPFTFATGDNVRVMVSGIPITNWEG